MDFKTPEEAKKYIEAVTKKPFKEEVDLDNPNVKKNIKVNHEGIANSFMKLVTMTKMSPISRKVMIMKMENPGISNMRVAITCGLMEPEVIKYEKEGIESCKKTLNKYSMQDSIDKANTDGIVEDAVRKLKLNKANPDL